MRDKTKVELFDNKFKNYFGQKNYLTVLLITLLLLLSTAFSVSAEREFTDMVGRRVILDDEINSVVTTYKPATQFMLSLGAGDKISAVSLKTDKQKLFVELEPGLAELPQVGSKRNGVNIETIASVNPDLVILYPHRDAEETAEKLKLQGIETVIINPESLELIKETTVLLGEILNKEEQAEDVIAAYNRIDSLTERTAGLDDGQKKSIYFANSEFTDTVGADMMQTALIENAGAVNPAVDLKAGFLTVSPENIIEWNPDLIAVSQYYKGSIEEIINSPEYQSLNAVQNEDVYRFPSQLEPWDFPSPSSYIAQLWLAVNSYPEYYSDVDYREEVNKFYNTLYGKNFEQLGGEFE